MDTLAFGYILPTTGRIRDFNPLETCAARRTYGKRTPKMMFFFPLNHLDFCKHIWVPSQQISFFDVNSCHKLADQFQFRSGLEYLFIYCHDSWLFASANQGSVKFVPCFQAVKNLMEYCTLFLYTKFLESSLPFYNNIPCSTNAVFKNCILELFSNAVV